MGPRNVGIESSEYVVKRVRHCLEMLLTRLQFSAQAKVILGATSCVRSRGAHEPSAFNTTDPPLIESRMCALPSGLFHFAGNRHHGFQAFVHAAQDRDAETEVDLIVFPKR